MSTAEKAVALICATGLAVMAGYILWKMSTRR